MFEELQKRGLVKQITNTDKIRNLLDNEKIAFYIGFDPTADSLHVGHLLQVITAKRLMNAGHIPVMLIGGATAMIGDPTGKSDMRKVLHQRDTMRNGREIEIQIMKLLGVSLDENGLIRGDDEIARSFSMMNNLDWLQGLDFLNFIQTVGPHFSVNNMLRAECFKSRLETGGLSFLEFNYMIMQAFDFFHLNQRHGCVLQIGGDDQWSNMLAGIDLIHKKTKKETFAMTLPLLANPDGTKMGKTERGAVWLDSKKTPIFDFFQFWRNIPDELVIPCFKLLTFFPLDEINQIPFNSVAEKNVAKKRLAFAITSIVHSPHEANIAITQAEALFENRDTSELQALHIMNNVDVLEIIVHVGFAKSRTDARNLIKNRGIVINNETLTDPTIKITIAQFGRDAVLKKGKKHFCKLLIGE